MKLEKVKLIIGIVVGLFAIGGSLLAVTSYFATAEDVEEKHIQLERTDALIAERMEIAIIEDRIYQQQQSKNRIEDKIVMQTVPREPTEAEKEAVREKEEEIARLEKERDEKQKFYEDLRKSR